MLCIIATTCLSYCTSIHIKDSQMRNLPTFKYFRDKTGQNITYFPEGYGHKHGILYNYFWKRRSVHLTNPMLCQWTSGTSKDKTTATIEEVQLRNFDVYQFFLISDHWLEGKTALKWRSRISGKWLNINLWLI